MFRKIRSNRDPHDTLLKELRKEFRPYFEHPGNRISQFTRLYPRFLFAIMVIALAGSVVFSFMVFKRPAEVQKKTAVPMDPVGTGFSQIMAASTALQKTISLKKRVDSLAHLKNLNKADSLELSNDLDSLKAIRQPFK